MQSLASPLVARGGILNTLGFLLRLKCCTTSSLAKREQVASDRLGPEQIREYRTRLADSLLNHAAKAIEIEGIEAEVSELERSAGTSASASATADGCRDGHLAAEFSHPNGPRYAEELKQRSHTVKIAAPLARGQKPPDGNAPAGRLGRLRFSGSSSGSAPAWSHSKNASAPAKRPQTSRIDLSAGFHPMTPRLVKGQESGYFIFSVSPASSILPFSRFVTSNSFTQRT